MRRERIRDKDGKVIGYGKPEEYESNFEEDAYKLMYFPWIML